ncbi:MAG: Mu-like prophage major head subunit gpT family protein, partial [Deltaproteobacteria bacterium]
EMGHLARMHPDEIVFALLRAGFTTNCFDGQFFFDTDHPTTLSDGTQSAVSNMQSGAGPAWYLLDTSRAVRPMIWQEREAYTFESLDRSTDPNVFFSNEFLYGVRARVNAGFGLWQLAYGSKAALTPANYAAARAAMQGFRTDQGRLLGIMPTTLVVPPALESDALSLLNTEIATGGASSNPWKNTAELVISPYVA